MLARNALCMSILALVACGARTIGSSQSSDAHARALCARYASARAGWIDRCRVTNTFAAPSNPDLPADVADACAALLSAPGSNPLHSSLAACADTLETTDDCDDIQECTNLHGNLGPNESCAFSMQCESGYCAPGANGCGRCTTPNNLDTDCPSCPSGYRCDRAGKNCVPPRPIAIGNDCRAAPRGCVTGAFCDETFHCRGVLDVGGICGWSSAPWCKAGLMCAYQHCSTPRPIGAKCVATGDVVCDVGLTCSGSESKCVVAQATPPNVGASCGKFLARCTAGLICFAGRCTEPRRRGEACSSSDPCAGFLECIDGRCNIANASRCP